ncbi:MAG TPA: hypothetical protein VGC35_12940 [Allosphingosinicella sp.]
MARLAGRLLEYVYPPKGSDWAQAMRWEIDSVEGDGAALLFALGCLWGGCRLRVADRIVLVIQGGTSMRNNFTALGEPRIAGIACAFAATLLGMMYMAAAGAPARYLVVNAAAFLLGLVALGGFAGAASRRFGSAVTILFGLCLLATALFGAAADGAARWIFIGPLGVQVSLVVVPFMIVAFAGRPDAAGFAGIAAAALALAIQPDRAMAAVLALGMVVLLSSRPSRWSALAALAAAAGFTAALARPEALPAVPFVDQILYTAFDVHPLAGAAVLLGSALLPVAAIAGWRRDPDRRHLYLTFAAVWLGCILAAAVGNYPTPVVGYGGSFILGYLLSLAALPTRQRASRALPEERRNQEARGHRGHSKAAFLR